MLSYNEIFLLQENKTERQWKGHDKKVWEKV